LESDHASEILNRFPEHLRNDVLLRIAVLDGVQPTALKELNDVLATLLTGDERRGKTPIGGVRSAAEIINCMSDEKEASVLAHLRNHDDALAEKVVDEMFVFDNILKIDDRGIQLLLREVQSDALIVALKGASPELSEKIFRNMSQRAAEMMRDDLDSKGPVRLSEVEAQQKQVLQVVRRLAEEGQLILGAKGQDAYV
jgi:flagellar motor switch protein FliG